VKSTYKFLSHTTLRRQLPGYARDFYDLQRLAG